MFPRIPSRGGDTYDPPMKGREPLRIRPWRQCLFTMDDYLSHEERQNLKALEAQDRFVRDVLAQSSRIAASRTFARVRDELRNFLAFVVAKKLLGLDSQVKEVTVAIAVFDEPADYDPAESSRVREAAKNLRLKLLQYYDEEGANDPIKIVTHAGSYVPEIRDCRISIALCRLANWNPNEDQSHLCIAMTDEMVHRFQRSGPIETACVTSLDEAAPACQYGLRGSLECQGDLVRVHVSLSDLKAETIVLGQTFQGERDDILKLSGEVVRAITSRLKDQDIMVTESPAIALAHRAEHQPSLPLRISKP
jgi:TolB-like protein